MDLELPLTTSLTPGATALHLAAAGGHQQCVTALIANKARVEVRDKQHWTPLLYADFVKHPNVLKVVALSGGYSREEANARMSRNHGVVASFSRALTEGLTAQQSDAEFNDTLDKAIAAIYEASAT